MQRCSDTNTIFQPLGVYSRPSEVLLFHRHIHDAPNAFHIDKSQDGIRFDPAYGGTIVDEKGKPVDLTHSYNFRFSKQKDIHVLTYLTKEKTKPIVYVATSGDLIHWVCIGKALGLRETSFIIPDYVYKNQYVVYTGEESVRIGFSDDLTYWTREKQVLLKPQKNFFAIWPLEVGTAVVMDQGIFLLYFIDKGSKTKHHYMVGGALFNREDPKKLVRLLPSLWETPNAWVEEYAYPIGAVVYGNNGISYWHAAKEGLVAVTHPIFHELKKPQQKTSPKIVLKKHKKNPILAPIGEHEWESKATFNPAALYTDGKVHIVYRAIGDRDVSVLGYAVSEDGITIDKRHPEPIYIPTEPFEVSKPYNTLPRTVSPYISGGGWFGGCEDPRLTKVEDKIYMTYVAYDGWRPPRVALTSIQEKDFLKGTWKWKKPVLISPPGIIDKNACIFPEKINGKYAILHRIFPDILIDFVDNLDFDGETFLKGEYKISPRSRYWDSRKIGAGPPPIKTPEGWLLIYQAVGNQDPSRYKIGAMLLDSLDPTHVSHRSNEPILEPTEWYENEGHKSGVAYPCGAVVLNNRLHVYYGGADTVTCVATSYLPAFLDQLQTSHQTHLTSFAALHA